LIEIIFHITFQNKFKFRNSLIFVITKNPGTSSRSSKRLKKASAVSVSFDTHRPVGSPDDVSIDFCGLLCLLLEFFFSCLPLTDPNETVRLFRH
jgi:hypothetical protein